MSFVLDWITAVHADYLTRRVMILLFTLEASAVTNLLTSLAGDVDADKATVLLLASLFYFAAACYAFAAEGLLQDRDEVTKSYADYVNDLREHAAADLAWWLAAHMAAIFYGTWLLWPANAGVDFQWHHRLAAAFIAASLMGVLIYRLHSKRKDRSVGGRA